MLETQNTVFVIIFAFEALIKMIGLGFNTYFALKQNCFDFALVLVSGIGFFKSIISLNVTLLRIIRGARILRVFKSLRELTELLQVLVESARSFMNVLILSLLALFVYALMGLRFFYRIEKGVFEGGIDKDANFRDIWTTIMTLLRVETLDGWNSLMHDTLLC